MSRPPTQETRRWPSRSEILLCGLMLATIVLLLAPSPATTRRGSVLYELGHVALGALLTLGVERVLRARGWRSLPAATGAAASALLFLGVMEGIQPLFGRGASLADLVASALGSIAALLLAGGGRGMAARRVAPALLGLGVLAGAVFGPVRTLWDIRRQEAAMPLLASFEDALELGRWRAAGAQVRRESAHPTHGGHDLRVVGNPGHAPILALHRPPPDWRAYEAVAMDIYLEGPRGLTVEFQLDDLHHECQAGYRALTRVRLEPGPNAVRIQLPALAESAPNGRTDLGAVARFGLMPVGPDQVRTLWLDRVHLEHATSPERRP